MVLRKHVKQANSQRDNQNLLSKMLNLCWAFFVVLIHLIWWGLDEKFQV